jgi:hypothetical protein
MRTATLIAASLFALFVPAVAAGQDASPNLDDIAITPSRREVVMEPGSEKTFLLNLIYTSGSGKSMPARLVSYLNDWTIDKTGQLQFFKAGARPESAAAWMVHSPGEINIGPGGIQPIRVTVSVPKDATPGDHTAALILEPRPDTLKNPANKKQVRTRFRLAAIFYIMVPKLTRQGSLQNLRAEANAKGIIIIPTIRNQGNSHIRPKHSVKIVDRAGVIAAELPDSEWLPVLGISETDVPLLIEKMVLPGVYTVRYRVDFGDGSSMTEGQTELVVKERASVAQSAGAGQTQPDKSQSPNRQQ